MYNYDPDLDENHCQAQSELAAAIKHVAKYLLIILPRTSQCLYLADKFQK